MPSRGPGPLRVQTPSGPPGRVAAALLAPATVSPLLRSRSRRAARVGGSSAVVLAGRLVGLVAHRPDALRALVRRQAPPAELVPAAAAAGRPARHVVAAAVLLHARAAAGAPPHALQRRSATSSDAAASASYCAHVRPWCHTLRCAAHVRRRHAAQRMMTNR